MVASSDARRAEILEAALGELRARGYAGTSMLAVATAARTSKETLYRLFGDKRGLFAALVRHNAGAVNADLAAALQSDRPPGEVLPQLGRGLARLLLGERSVAINRAAIAEAATSSELGATLAAAGRGTTGPLIRQYLEAQRARGRLTYPSVEEAFEVFLGLLLRDRQVRVLLGVLPTPPNEELDALADRATAYFLRLFGPAADVRP
jgi:AcrR family transcriptional regulator